MIILSHSLVLSEAQVFDADNPIVGWENLVAPGNLIADFADPDAPAVNLANPNTSLLWRSTTAADQYLTVVLNFASSVDYVGIARHNFGSSAQQVSIEGQAAEAGAWSVLVEELILADDSPVLFRFPLQPLYAVRVRMRLGSVPPRAAVLYAGPLLVMERGLYVGHTPLRYARRVRAIDGAAESGDFLGTVIVGEYRESTARFTHLDPAWWRANVEPFLNFAASQRQPFFFGWRPSTYPRESGFARLINDPQPTPDSLSHLTEIEMQMRGVP